MITPVAVTNIAALTGAQISGNSGLLITGVSDLIHAKPGDLSFLFRDSYAKHIENTHASALFVSAGYTQTRSDITYLVVANPLVAAVLTVNAYFLDAPVLSGVDPSAFVHPTAKLGEGVSLGKNVVISPGVTIGANCTISHNTVLMDDVSVGSDCYIYPNVTLREKTVIGNRCIIHSGAVLGADGFGYYPDAEKRQVKIPQIGNVVLEDDVEIGANTTIDRATFGSTIVKRGVKLDNLVMIGHNVSVGENTVMSGQTGVSGSTKIGKNCIFAGHVGLADHIEIGDNVIITGQSAVGKSILKPGIYSGRRAVEMKEALKSEAYVRDLPNTVNRIAELEKKIKALEERLDDKSR